MQVAHEPDTRVETPVLIPVEVPVEHQFVQDPSIWTPYVRPPGVPIRGTYISERTMSYVLRQAQKLVLFKGVTSGGQGCILQRVAEAHNDAYGERIGWVAAGHTYFRDYPHIAHVNDGIASDQRRAKWAVGTLENQARRLQGKSYPEDAW